MKKELKNKLENLYEIIAGLPPFAVALSGGKDSSFLFEAACDSGREDFIALTVVTPYTFPEEKQYTEQLLRNRKIYHKFISIPIPQALEKNPPERCYLCKKIIFSSLLEEAGKNNIHLVCDGTQKSDEAQYRPGKKALKELGIRSPLSEANLTEREIREILSERFPVMAARPSNSCALTRLPHGESITEALLKKIIDGEKILTGYGYPGSRMRIHGELVRIELKKQSLQNFIGDKNLKGITAALKELGFRYVCLDLEGYKSGSFDPVNKAECYEY